MSRRTLLLVTAAMLVAALSSWLSRQIGEEAPGTDAAQRHVVDYYLTRFNAVTMDDAGRPRYQLGGERLVHYSDTDTMELTAPDVVLFREDGANWRARAATGWVSPGGERIELDGDVEIFQGETPEQARIRVQTEHIELQPENNLAQTDAQVTVTGPVSRMTATGLKAYLAEDRLVLLSDVRGTHEPAAR